MEDHKHFSYEIDRYDDDSDLSYILVKESSNISQVPEWAQKSDKKQGVPDWIKNTAGWWASDMITETEFISAIEFLVQGGIIQIS